MFGTYNLLKTQQFQKIHANLDSANQSEEDIEAWILIAVLCIYRKFVENLEFVLVVSIYFRNKTQYLKQLPYSSKEQIINGRYIWVGSGIIRKPGKHN